MVGCTGENITGSLRNSFNQHAVVMQQSVPSFATQRQLYAVALKKKLSTQTLSTAEWICLVSTERKSTSSKVAHYMGSWLIYSRVSPYAFTEHYPICWSPETDSRAVKTDCVLIADKRLVTWAKFTDNTALRLAVREISLWWTCDVYSLRGE